MARPTPRILLVDDEPELLSVCTDALADLAGEICTAHDGKQAIDLAAENNFDLIISDLRMPNADGVALLKAVRGLDTDVMVLTGYGTIDSAVECVRLGAVNYLLKPFRVAQLREAVTKALQERGMRAGQAKPGNLSRMLSLHGALSAQGDVKTLIREFLGQLKAAFSPDGIAFFTQGQDNGLGLAPLAMIGPFFRDNQRGRDWFSALAASIAEKSRPMLLEEPILREAFGSNGHDGRAPTTAMGAPVGGPNAPRGAVVVMRAHGREPYSIEELRLLTLFTAHTSLCLESHQAGRRLKSMYDGIVFSLVHAVEAKDTYTRGHSERVSRYAALLARALDLPECDVETVATAGMLHDIGKIGVPDSILNKPGPLQADEMSVMRQHPVIARTILEKVESLNSLLPVVCHHHERMDGNGYPDGLSGEDIPLLARLISVVDCFEAMTSDRAYHSARSRQDACALLLRGRGSHWDPRLVDIWVDLVNKGVLF